MHGKHNSIGFLRVLLASLVIVSHSYALGHYRGEPLLTFSNVQLSFGSMAVAGFFCLSGFLITRSYGTSGSLGRYLWHRALRIMPGYWVCLVVTAFFLGSIGYLIEYHQLAPYLQDSRLGPLAYVQANYRLSIHQFSISTLFAHNPQPNLFNSSIWTLEVEARCYLATGVLGLLGVFSRARPMVLLLALGLWFLHGPGHGYYHPTWLIPQPSYIAPYLYFAIGASCFLYRKHLVYSAPLLTLAALVALASLHYGGALYLVPIPFCYILLFLAARLPLRDFDRRGDFSYGIYIYAFPVQQFLILLGLGGSGVGIFLLCSLVATLPLAILSWHLVEKPCLRLKHAQIPALSRLLRQGRPAGEGG